jgi:hypothetical protein
MTPEEALNKLAENQAMQLALFERLRDQVAQMERDAEELQAYIADVVGLDVKSRIAWELLQFHKNGDKPPKRYPGITLSPAMPLGGVGLGVRNTNGNNS